MLIKPLGAQNAENVFTAKPDYEDTWSRIVIKWLFAMNAERSFLMVELWSAIVIRIIKIWAAVLFHAENVEKHLAAAARNRFTYVSTPERDRMVVDFVGKRSLTVVH